MGQAVAALWANWERQLFDELAKLSEKLPLPSAGERALIERLITAGRLPDEVSAELLLAQSSVLTVAEFDQAVERFKAPLLKGTDAHLVGVKAV